MHPIGWTWALGMGAQALAWLPIESAVAQGVRRGVDRPYGADTRRLARVEGSRHGTVQPDAPAATGTPFNGRQPISRAQASSTSNAATVTGTPRRANSRNEIVMPVARACCTTIRLETLPTTSRLPPKLLANART